jgi:lysophospholipase L1-like esterase
LLNIGKNNINVNTAPAADIIRRTNEAWDWLAPQYKRSLVVNHFVNRDANPAVYEQYGKVREVNDALAERFGPFVVDIYSFVCLGLPQFGKAIWEVAVITPTQADLAAQAAGKKPPSLSADDLHLNAAGNKAVAWLLRQKLISLGWYSA